METKLFEEVIIRDCIYLECVYEEKDFNLISQLKIGEQIVLDDGSIIKRIN